MTTHSSILAWKTPWAEEPGGLQPWRLKESDMTERLSHQPCRRTLTNAGTSPMAQIATVRPQTALAFVSLLEERNEKATAVHTETDQWRNSWEASGSLGNIRHSETNGVPRVINYWSLRHSPSEHSLWVLSFGFPLATGCLTAIKAGLEEARRWGPQRWSSALQMSFFKLKAINLFLFKWQMDCSLQRKENPYVWKGKNRATVKIWVYALIE